MERRLSAPRGTVAEHPVNAGARRPFLLQLRVYYEDTDAAGIVYYANYLRYLERARTDWLRALGVEQQRLREDSGIGFAVRSLGAEYLKPARLDDLLTVSCALSELGRAQLVFAQQVARGEETLLTARVRVACMDLVRMRPAAIPHELRKRLTS